MLDNVVEINGLPLEGQRDEILRKRRHGMGYLGLGSTLTMLRMKYGSSESVEFTEQVTREMAVAGWESALELAEEKGPAPIMNEEFVVSEEMLRKRPEMARDGWKAGDIILGKELHARYSRYMQRVAEVAPQLVEKLAATGARFTHHTSIAPTGTISLSLANNASNGIAPSFAHHYFRNVIREGKKSKEKIDVYSFELLAYRKLVNAKALPFSDKEDEKLPDYFITADDITPKEHVDIQAAAQRWVDSSISKTANVPTNYPYEQFKDIYLYAYDQGLKGCTTFRFNPEAFQGVLVKESDLANTTDRFTLEDGSTVEVMGNEEIERPDMLVGSTYKVKTPLSEHALYVTINDVVLNEGTPHELRRPFEIFINSKNMDHFQWIVALTRIISAVFRKGGDVTFLVEELKAVFDPRGGYFKKGGKYMPSLVAEIGDAIENHLRMIGLLQDTGPDEHQRKLIAEKRTQIDQRAASADT